MASNTNANANSSRQATDLRQQIKDNKAKVDELRTRFFEECGEENGESLYDPRDLDWVRKSDAYVHSVFLIGKQDIDAALEKMKKILKWRKEFGVNDITFESFPEEFQQMGALYSHATDKKGLRILWYRVKFYRKEPEYQKWARKMTVYWLNKLQKSNPYDRIVVMEDMTGAGLANMDIEMVRFMITCFELYFPAFVDMLYIYDMPWILNAAWKIVENFLSAVAREHIKFIRGKEVQTYIDLDSLPPHMGGSDTYEWRYIPEDEDLEMKDVEAEEEEIDGGDVADGDVTFRSVDGDNDLSLQPVNNAVQSPRQQRQPKKVHFQDNLEDKENVDPDHNSSHRKHKRHGSHSKRSKSRDVHSGPLISIRPGELLVFEAPSSISGSEGISSSLTITNTTERRVVYKVKTTTPERYKVRPSMGPVNPGSSIHITITLLSGPGELVVRDKFLILSSEPAEGASFKATSEMAHFWKSVRLEDRFEHRMSCLYSPHKSARADTPEAADRNVQSILTKLKIMEFQMAEMKSQISRLLWLQGFVLLTVLLLLLFLYFHRPTEGVLVSYDASGQSSCPEATEKFLRGARESL
ncbi:motile sperm domain-containing protein 2-like [Diadema setosum]|uniref:motile sperm domain-containing protein 2-like n=1 Tax=Diadema setosum TaxID=31175 RepID=UPI003B3ADDF1